VGGGFAHTIARVICGDKQRYGAQQGMDWQLIVWAVACLGWVLGCAVQLQQAQLYFGPIYVLFWLIAPVFAAWAANKLIAFNKLSSGIYIATGRAAVLMVAAAALGFGCTGLRAVVFQAQALPASLEGADVQLMGVVASMPQRSEAGLRFRLDVESAVVKQADGWRIAAVPPRVLLSWYSAVPRTEDPALAPMAELPAGAPTLHAGERWALTARLKAPHGNSNPHGFDYELWLWEQGLQATGYVRATPKEAALGQAPRRLGNTWQHPIERLRETVRDAIYQKVTDPRQAGVIAALSMGDQASIERSDWEVYRATGVAHLMSISGLHITMFAWAAALCVGWLWRRSARAMHWLPAQHAALIGGVLLAAAYALFSGWGVPSQRTVWMLATVALLRLSGKQWPWPMVWLLTCAVVVAFDPWALLQAGFWLSFVAVGVLFASDPRGSGPQPSQHNHTVNSQLAGEPVPSQPPWHQHSVVRKTMALAHEQWRITLALAPLSLLLFQQVSLVGLLANAVAVPWVTLVVTPLALLGTLWPALWTAAAWAVQCLGMVLQWFASLPFATFSVAASAVLIGFTAVLGSLLAVLRLPWPLRAMGLAMVLPALWWQAPRPALGQFELLAADIGQGNAVLVRTAHHSLLYDTGPRLSRESDAGQRTLVPLLRALGERLDTLIVSHRDSDHSGGALAVQAMQPQAALLSSLEDQHEILAARTPSQTTQRCTAGQRWQWDGIDFDILHPQAADYELHNKPNAISCVLRISNGSRTALLVADIEAAQEARLVQTYASTYTPTYVQSYTQTARLPPVELPASTPPNATPTVNFLHADILLAPHHGSKTSSTDAFLDAVQPSVAIFQSGYRNRFNHPAPEVAQRYSDRGIHMVASPRCGAATWSSQQPHSVTCQRQLQQRYWQHQIP
jgi:competence protein ComEC